MSIRKMSDQSKEALLSDEPVIGFADDNGFIHTDRDDPTEPDDTTDGKAYKVKLLGVEGEPLPFAMDISGRRTYPEGVSEKALDWIPTDRSLAIITADARIISLKDQISDNRSAQNRMQARGRELRAMMRDARQALKDAKAMPKDE